jgi:hypothetical protein
MNGVTRVQAGFVCLRILSCSGLLSTYGCREFLNHVGDYNLVMRNLAPSSYLISSQSADPRPKVEITMKICPPPPIIMHFTSSVKHDLNSWKNTTKQNTPESIVN